MITEKRHRYHIGLLDHGGVTSPYKAGIISMKLLIRIYTSVDGHHKSARQTIHSAFRKGL